MTVKELIEVLQQYDQNWPVYSLGHTGWNEIDYTPVIPRLSEYEDIVNNQIVTVHEVIL